jgi:hypothetical protein
MKVLAVPTRTEPGISPIASVPRVHIKVDVRNIIRLIQPSSSLTHEIVDLLHARRWGYIWVKTLLHQLRPFGQRSGGHTVIANSVTQIGRWKVFQYSSILALKASKVVL